LVKRVRVGINAERNKVYKNQHKYDYRHNNSQAQQHTLARAAFIFAEKSIRAAAYRAYALLLGGLKQYQHDNTGA